MIEVKKNTEEQTCLLVDLQTGKEIGMIKSPPIAIKLRDLYNAFENTSPNEMRAQFLAIIKRFEKKKAESEYALGFAIDRVERFEAEKAEVLEVLERIRDESGPFNLGEMRNLVESAIRKARGEE